MKKRKIIVITGIVIICLLMAGLFIVKNKKQDKESEYDKLHKEVSQKDWKQTDGQSSEEDDSIAFELNLIDKCDSGEWIEVNNDNSRDNQGEFSGVIESLEENGKTDYFFENGKGLVFEKENVGEFLEDRSVTIIGEMREGEVVVRKIKCIEDNRDGIDSTVDQETENFEQKTMIQIEAKIDSLTKKVGNWEVVSYLWPNREYVYAEFSAIENEDMAVGDVLSYDEVESFLLLLRVKEKSPSVGIEEIGLLKMDEEDEWVALRGEDLFDDIDDGRLFDFDEDNRRWTKIN